MNISNNKRYQITDAKIEQAFLRLIKKKKIDSIFVSDICKEAAITRTAFYSHYDDINHLILHLQKKFANEISDILITSQRPAHDSFVRYFTYLKDRADFYKIYLMSEDSQRSTEELSRHVMELQHSEALNLKTSPASSSYQMIFFAGGLKAIAYRWLIGGCVETVDEMARVACECYPW